MLQKRRSRTIPPGEAEKFAYHRGQRIDDARAPSVAVVGEAFTDRFHIIVVLRILPAGTVRLSAAVVTPQGRTNLYAS